MQIQKYKRGQIWWYSSNTNYDGNVQGGSRPIIIMSNDLANAYSKCLIGIPCTTAEKKSMATHTSFEINNTMSTALAENLMSINISRLTDYIGMVDTDLLHRLEYNIAVALGLPLSVFGKQADILVKKSDENKNLIQNNTNPKNNIGRKPKYSKDDMIRFINDYENHDKEFMLQKYNLKDTRALQQKAYMFRKQIKE